jgi:hypothetical protein
MAAPLPPSEQQFIDADGHPYAGGSLGTYVVGTMTPKATWRDAAATALNTNPITLDSAGRCIAFGDGLYRTILKDALGNTIWDQLASTLVSAAMAPVVIAPTIAAAVALLGIQDMIDAEAAARAAADAAEAATRAAQVAALSAEDVVLAAAIAAETAARIAADTALGARIDAIPTAIAKSGQAVTDSSGHGRVTYPAAFPTNTIAVSVVQHGAGYDLICASVAADAAGFDVWLAFPMLSEPFVRPAGARGFYWTATGD